MGDMKGERGFTPNPISQSTVIDKPSTLTGGGKGRIPTIPGSGQGFRPERQPSPRKSHKLRNTLVGLAATGAVGAGVYVGTHGENESSTTNTAVVTTVDLNPDGSVATTSVPEPTTTLEPKPTDVVEHRDGYDVLRNGGFLYEVPSTPEFGGFEVHMGYSKYTYGLAEAEAGEELTQETLFYNLLWTFANQHPEFIKPDGQPDVDAYRSYLSNNNWVDTVYLPKNIHIDKDDSHYPPVVPSDPIELDFKKPFVISNTDLNGIDGFSAENVNLYQPASGDNIYELFGINDDGQLYFGFYERDVRTNVAKELRMIPPLEDFPISHTLGEILSITSRITYPAETPRHSWVEPSVYFFNPASKTPSNSPAPYALPNVFDFIQLNDSRTGWTNELFKPITK